MCVCVCVCIVCICACWCDQSVGSQAKEVLCICHSNPEPNPTYAYFLTLITAAFSPESKETLKPAVDECIISSPIGDCSEVPYGPIRDWDVSAVTDMSQMFHGASAFNQDLSKWDVSAVANMWFMFNGASAFNQDLSKWDVSAATSMRYMFYGASAFDRELTGLAWGHSKADKTDMFKESPGSISKVCTRDKTGNHESVAYGGG